MKKTTQLEEGTQAIGRELLASVRLRERRMGPAWLYNRLMRLAMSDESLKIQLFRFVDVLPTLKTPHAVARHLLEFLDQPQVKLPPGTKRMLHLLSATTPTEWLLGDAAQIGANIMAHRFIAGENARQAIGAVERLRRLKMAFSLDLLGEAVTSESEALAYQEKYLAVIHDLSRLAGPWDTDLQLDAAPHGPVPRVNVSIKLSSLYARFDPMAAHDTAESVKARLRPILSAAREQGAFINFDMEQYDYREITLRIFEEILLEEKYRDWTDVGIVVQAYLRDAEDELNQILGWAKQRGAPVWVRLVKGAYWDYETMIAAQRGYPSPVFTRKAETDANYERLSHLLLQNWETLHPAIATHNVRSASHSLALAKALELPRGAVEYQVLFGMGEPIGHALAERGERVRVYVPFGELLPGIAYLVRRLLENTSNESFVRHIEQDEFVDSELLAPPSSLLSNNKEQAISTPAFHNEPATDFAIAENRQAMESALAQARERLGEIVPIVIDGDQEESTTLFERLNPSDSSLIASRSYWATVEQAERAIAVAHTAFPEWRNTTVRKRTALLRGVAAEFRRRRFDISSWQVYETGKPWRDADADVAEAIDFCEFYADEMERLATPRKRNVPGEWNEYIYDSRGPAVIIAPWNFPLAILTGMTVAALVTGNPVIIKPAEQSSRIGYFLMEALIASGVPAGVANFLPGEGETVGPILVNDPRVSIVAFTGSRAVGLSIIKAAAEIQPGQREVKRVIAEMGGKNAIIVDEDADLDEAVLGVLASTIGYSGQKCSACSRAIVIGSAYEPFCARLAEAIKSIRIGPADDPATTLGPLIDQAAQERVLRYLEIGESEGKLVARIDAPNELKYKGFYVPAAVFTGCPPNGKLCQDEIFGPILAVITAENLSEALSIADNSLYALTGGFYSRSPKNIEQVRREFRVGNLYINRKITGALVDRQPFGGHQMSGIGSKAGGPDYLSQFLLPRTITELVMRRGFAPSEEIAANYSNNATEEGI